MVTNNPQKGFTIVELLIVIVVIGILAAIVIVAFNGVQNSANEAAVKSDLATIAKKLDIYKATSTSGSYPANTGELDTMGLRASHGSYLTNRNNFYYCPSGDNQHYAVGVYVKNETQYFLEDGAVTPASGVSGPVTCDQVGGTAYRVGYADPAQGGSGWQGWTQ